MDVTLPNGRVIRGVPDGTSKDAIRAKAISSGLATDADFGGVAPEPTYDPTADMSTGQRLLAGVGKGMTDLGYGAGQLLGMVPQEAIAEKARIDAPLAATTAGKVGEVGGKIAAAIPAAFLPGAASIAGGAAIGGGLGALEPVAEGNVLAGKAENVGMGALFGAGGNLAGKQIGKFAKDRVAAALDRLNVARGGQSMQDAALAGGRDLGLTVAPTHANPTMINSLVEGLSGKAATAQRAAMKNQERAGQIVRKELGLAPDAPLSDDTFQVLRNTASQAYDAVKNVGSPIKADQKYLDDLAEVAAGNQRLAQDFPELANQGLDEFVASLAKPEFGPDNAIEAIKRLRFNAGPLYKSDDPAKLALAKASKRAANAIEALVERNLKDMGAEDLYKGFVDARQLMAKSYTIEDAVNKGSGNVILPKLAAALQKGKPLSGDLKKVAEFAQTFKKSTQEITSSMPMVSPLDYMVGAMGLGGAAINPLLLGVGAARPLAREALTSAPYQRLMTQPSYSPSMVTQGMGLLGNAPTAQAGGLLGASVYPAQQ